MAVDRGLEESQEVPVRGDAAMVIASIPRRTSLTWSKLRPHASPPRYGLRGDLYRRMRRSCERNGPKRCVGRRGDSRSEWRGYRRGR